MEVKYKSPKPGKSLLDKVAAKSSRGRVRGVSLGHRGGDRADDEGQRGGAKRGPKAKGPSRTAKERDVGSAGDGDEAPVNEGGSPAVRTEGEKSKNEACVGLLLCLVHVCCLSFLSGCQVLVFVCRVGEKFCCCSRWPTLRPSIFKGTTLYKAYFVLAHTCGPI